MLPWGFPGGASGEESISNAGDSRVWSLGQKDPLEEGMATHSSILAWRTPWTEGAWWATVHGVTKSRTGLKQLSTHACTSSWSFDGKGSEVETRHKTQVQTQTHSAAMPCSAATQTTLSWELSGENMT